ncbi:MAG: DUF4271 domain-containing protein [Dysgonamonadaceae bacterium]|jgi:hypothetical protein|nr:DUF4271 domain-containing protein [Dysgonamonadaceae bacterium]
MTKELLPEWPIVQNWGFVLFLCCFFISTQLAGKGWRLFYSMQQDLFWQRYRSSIFFDSVDNEMIRKLLLVFQTVVLSSLFIYCVFYHSAAVPFGSVTQMFWLLGTASALITAFFICKFISNTLIGNIFFQRDSVRLLNRNLLSVISLSGPVLFVPALLMFYVKEAYSVCYYFILAYFLLAEMLIVYKTYVIFFSDKRLLLYFILYLCAQEIVSLYLSYKALVYLLIQLQKSTLWLQM